MNTHFFKFLFLLFFSIFIFYSNANDLVLKTKSTELTISKKAFYSSIKVEGKELLKDKSYPIITACLNEKLILPKKMSFDGNLLNIIMNDGQKIQLKYQETEICITLEISEIPESYNAVIFGPIGLNINEIVGDIIGVVQGNGVAFGVQSLNIKTVAGLPYEYKDIVPQYFKYEGEAAEVSTSTIPFYRLAATKTIDGSMIQFSCRRRNETEYRQVQQIEKSLTLPVEGEDALIKGAKIAIFGCKQPDALARIGEIEIEQGLPHPVYDGEWGKTNRACMQSYLITNFNEETLDFVVGKAKRAGFQYIYEMDAFETWGHFDWSQEFVKGGDNEVQKMIERAEKQGVHVGIHTLSNFMTTNDRYVTPIPSKHLLKQGILQLINDIDSTQTEIKIKNSDYFGMPMTLNALQIDNELIKYGEHEAEGDFMILERCGRGAFGTTATSHSKETPLYKLWDYPYQTLFPDLTLQDSMADRLVEIFNNTGLRQISFDGLEGCCYTGQDDYATARFVTRCYSGWQNPIINDASNLNHFTWHIHSRMNWGEPWGEAMREGQVKARIKNQDFFRRNLFPRMLGWFLIRLADKKFECTSLEDLEWALSESAGFDAGYAMTINQKVLHNHGNINQLLDAIKNWDYLRYHDVFTEEQKEKLRDPLTEWHLEKVDENQFVLYQLDISKPYHCNFGELQPGQPGGSDWSLESEYESRCAIRLYVDGDGEITNPRFVSPKGSVVFPCTVKGGQYLLYYFNGRAVITDRNYNEIEIVEEQGVLEVAKGTSAVSFYCQEAEEGIEVVVRFRMRGEGLDIFVRND